MLLIKVNSRFCLKFTPSIATINSRSQTQSAVATLASNEIAPAPIYPPIEDISTVGRFRKKLTVWHDEVKAVNTVEEKMIKINMPRYWGLKCMMVEEGHSCYNNLPLAQHITRTHIPEEAKLPAYYDNLISEEKLNSLVKDIKEAFEDAVAFEMTNRLHNQEHSKIHLQGAGILDDLIGDAVCKQINRVMLNNLAIHYPHLLTAQVDHDPRIESYWFAGGINMCIQTRQSFKRSFSRDPHAYELLKEPIDRIFQYLGNPSLQLRHALPLKEILPVSECQNESLEIPVCKHDPRLYGHPIKRRHVTAVPGFWPGDQCEFGLMSYHKRGYLFRASTTRDDHLDRIKTQVVFANWGWLTSQAHHLGFTTFNEITYPLVNQMIVTNGQMWTFATYQLNTNMLWGRNNENNPKRNICWLTEPMKLFERVENNKLVGVNDDVLKHLIKLYINTPEERAGVNMKPYLGETEQRIAQLRHDVRRTWLEDRYKKLLCNRPRHRLMPEMYHWEWIYKHIFKTRPMDKRRTHWDFELNPLLRRLDEHTGAYIPKALRRKNMKIRWNGDKLARTWYP